MLQEQAERLTSYDPQAATAIPNDRVHSKDGAWVCQGKPLKFDLEVGMGN